MAFPSPFVVHLFNEAFASENGRTARNPVLSTFAFFISTHSVLWDGLGYYDA